MMGFFIYMICFVFYIYSLHIACNINKERFTFLQHFIFLICSFLVPLGVYAVINKVFAIIPADYILNIGGVFMIVFYIFISAFVDSLFTYRHTKTESNSLALINKVHIQGYKDSWQFCFYLKRFPKKWTYFFHDFRTMYYKILISFVLSFLTKNGLSKFITIIRLIINMELDIFQSQTSFWKCFLLNILYQIIWIFSYFIYFLQLPNDLYYLYYIGIFLCICMNLCRWVNSFVQKTITHYLTRLYYDTPEIHQINDLSILEKKAEEKALENIEFHYNFENIFFYILKNDPSFVIWKEKFFDK